jgi:putative thioredoxin
MEDSPYIINIDQSNFQDVVVEGSRQRPVLVDFWADWCGPCKTLMPVLAKLVDEFQGKFILAKVDTEAQQALAAENGIRSLPTVRLYYQGQVVEEFMGVQPESTIREMIDKHLPRQSDDDIAKAFSFIEQGNLSAALELAAVAHDSDPTNLRVTLAYAEWSIADGDLVKATELLDQLPVADSLKDEVSQVRAHLHFAQISADAPSRTECQQQLEQHPEDSALRYQLAALLVVEQDYDGAVEEFLSLMRTDRKFQDDAARKALLCVFELLGDAEPRVKQYRSKMAALLY